MHQGVSNPDQNEKAARDPYISFNSDISEKKPRTADAAQGDGSGDDQRGEECIPGDEDERLQDGKESHAVPEDHSGSATPKDQETRSGSQTPASNKKTAADYKREIEERKRKVRGVSTGLGAIPTAKDGGTINASERNFPEIGKFVLTIVSDHGRPINKLTAVQLRDLMNTPISLKHNVDFGKTVADLFAEDEKEFRAWAATIPGTLKRHNKQVTVKNVIDSMRGYDWREVGYGAWLASKGKAPAEPARETQSSDHYDPDWDYDPYKPYKHDVVPDDVDLYADVRKKRNPSSYEQRDEGSPPPAP